MSRVMNLLKSDHGASETDSPYAWARLWTALALGTIGCVGMWSVVVALPAVQADFGVLRADASVPYTLAMLGFGAGNVIFGKLSDRYGIMVPIALSALALFVGYVGAGFAASLWQFAALHFLIGLGASATFGPLMADTSQWFTKRRGIAVAIAASGNYLAGTVWPPIFQYFISTSGWRAAHIGVGIFCVIAMLPLTLMMRRSIPSHAGSPAAANAQGALDRLGISKNALTVILSVASVACCVAMAMPQVHIVAYLSLIHI